MYVIRRVYKTKPGQAKAVASRYRDAGQRSEIRVSYNSYTLPGKQNIVFVEWTDDTIQSPSRPGNALPQEALQIGGEVRKLIESQRIEFYEMLTPDEG